MARPTKARKDEEKKGVSVTHAADTLGELVNRVAFKGETVLLTRYNKPVAKLVPIDAAA